MLPARELIVPEPSKRPTPQLGDDARIFARKALDYGDSNRQRLIQAGENYQTLIDTYGGEK